MPSYTYTNPENLVKIDLEVSEIMGWDCQWSANLRFFSSQQHWLNLGLAMQSLTIN